MEDSLIRAMKRVTWSMKTSTLREATRWKARGSRLLKGVDVRLLPFAGAFQPSTLKV